MYRQAISKTAEDYVCNVLMYQKLEIKNEKKKKSSTKLSISGIKTT